LGVSHQRSGHPDHGRGIIIAGVAGIIGRRPSVAVIGFRAGAVTAFVPTILSTLISQNTAAALQICG
jgi:hypothetical protein